MKKELTQKQIEAQFKKRVENKQCGICGTPLAIVDRNKHLYRHTCKCVPPDLIISVR